MINLRLALSGAKIQLGRLVGSKKSAGILICNLIFSYNLYIPMIQMAQVYGEKIPPVAFVFYLSFYRMLVLHGGVVIFLFSDLLINDSFYTWQVLRMGKKNFILGQIIYVLIASLIYVIMLYVLSLIMTIPVLRSFSEWGKLLYTMSDNLGGMVAATGISAAYSISGMILETLTPIEALLYSMLLMWLTTSFVGMLILGFTTVLTRSVGIGIAGVIVCMPLFAMFAGFVTVGRWLNYISPMSWSYIGLLDLYHTGDWPTIQYAVIFLSIGIILMAGISTIWFTRKDIRG